MRLISGSRRQAQHFERSTGAIFFFLSYIEAREPKEPEIEI